MLCRWTATRRALCIVIHVACVTSASAPGATSCSIDGSLQGIDGLSLTFALSPRVITVSAAGWDTSGILQRHLQNGVLGLIRHRDSADATGSSARQEEFPAFVGIQRMFHLGHDWTIDTTVQRIAPKSSGFTVTVPLLERESVTAADLEARNRAVTVALAAGEESTRFSSMIPVSDAIELAAAEVLRTRSCGASTSDPHGTCSSRAPPRCCRRRAAKA